MLTSVFQLPTSGFQRSEVSRATRGPASEPIAENRKADMRVIALDTTTRAGSAALVSDDRVVDERSGDGSRTHALRLPGELLALADANGWRLSEVDLYAVASGP